MHQRTLLRTQSTETFGREHQVYTLRYLDSQELLREHQHHRNQLCINRWDSKQIKAFCTAEETAQSIRTAYKTR